MVTNFDARQSRSRDTLDQLATTADKEVDDLLRSINKEATPPLQMHQDDGLNRVLKIEDYTITNPETNKKKTIPPIDGSLPAGITFPISITFPSSSGGAIGISGTSFSGPAPNLTVSSGNYIKVGVNLESSGNITLTFGTEGASPSAAGAPATIVATQAIGHVLLQNVAGTISNVTNANIYQYYGVAAAASMLSATPSVTGIVTSYAPIVRDSVKAVSGANYTITETDGYEYVLVTTGAADRTIALPSTAVSAGRRLSIKKVDSGVGKVLISGTIDGDVGGGALDLQYEVMTVVCDGSAWFIVS